MKPGKLADAVSEQIASNKSAKGHEASFAEHRERLTSEIAARAPESGRGRLCLLGAGNANDVDLEALALRFAEIHLVDIDADAVVQTIMRVPSPARAQLVAQAPLDVSGMFDRFEKWADEPPTPEMLERFVRAAIARITDALPGTFDVVVSCSVLTQLQLVLLQVVGDTNPKFVELRAALNRAHMRALGALIAPGGIGLLVTDLTSNEIYPPLAELPADTDLGKLMSDLIGAGSIIYVANPGPLSAELRRDPQLKKQFSVRFPIGPWIWRNGPDQVLLVYALEIQKSEG
jgi:hypothetical protein